MLYETIGSSPVDFAGKTHPEIRAVADEDGSVLVVPVASLEQHGHHMPVVTDTLLVDAVVHEGAERADAPVLVTPPVWTGRSPHHLPFGGTASLSTGTLLSALEELADSTLGDGFDALLLVNGHGGNVSVIADAVSEVGVAHPGAEVAGLTYFSLAAEWIDEIRESDPGGVAHAGELETSLMLHLRPDLVREDHVAGAHRTTPSEFTRDDMFESAPVTAYRDYDEYTETGAVGDPHLATADKGKEALDRLGEALARVVTEASERNA